METGAVSRVDNPFDPLAESDVVRSFVAGLIGDLDGFQSLIHPKDEMYLYGLDSLRGSRECAAILYFLKGHQIAQAVHEIVRWRFGSLSEVGAVLDFASGYGRATRFLVREVSPARLWVTDISTEAVEFQKSVFGVGGFLSTPRSDEFLPQRTFDVIQASSFFSHLPEATFGSWLRAVYDLLSPEGVLAFSVHGNELLGDALEEDPGEIVFVADSESRTLDPRDYGTSYVTEGFVRRIVSREVGKSASLQVFTRGLCGHQDLYVLTRGASVQRALCVPNYLRGDLLDIERDDDADITIRGWITDGADGTMIGAVQLVVNARVRDEWKPPEGHLPAARLQWILRCRSRLVSLDDVVAVHGVTDRGLVNIVAMGTLRPLYGSGAQAGVTEG